MTTQVAEQVARFSLEKLDAMIDVVAGLSDAEANARPDFPGANSPYGLLTHVLGMARAWSSTNNLGVPIPRDRDAEFTAAGPVGELITRARAVRDDLARDFDATDWAATPTNPRKGRDEWWAQSTHGVALHIFEEVCQHLGHLEITVDAIRAQAAKVTPHGGV